MKIKDLLVFCLLQLISISAFGQFTYSYDDKTVTINGRTIKKPSGSNSRSGTRSSSSVGSSIGGALGEAAANLLIGLISQKLHNPTGNNNSLGNLPVYYFNGVYYASEEEFDAAIMKFIEEFEQGKQELLADLKGMGQETANPLKLKGNPFEVRQGIIESYPGSLEEMANSLDFKPMKAPQHDENGIPIYSNFFSGNLKEIDQVMIAMGIIGTVDYINKTSFLGTSGSGRLVSTGVSSATVLMKAYSEGQPLTDKTVIRNAIVDGASSLAGSYKFKKLNHSEAAQIAQEVGVMYTLDRLMQGKTRQDATKDAGDNAIKAIVGTMFDAAF